ncbi:phosphoadenosine phosphosulfate reductase domain-containing protein [Scrofimicrobium canadense]|nr:phosphoadenosine phosphosulfate reductase family protein [Scrofimicrobium canadense]
MLIDMPTLTAADRARWSELERFDQRIGRLPARMIDEALDEIRTFKERNPNCVCSTSWGKDSVVVAWLTRQTDPMIPLVWVPTIRADGMSYEAEATYQVRDAFLKAFPGAYEERPATARNPKRGDPDYNPAQFDRPDYRSQDVLKENIPEPSINGVRAEESQMRARSLRWHGVSSKNSCRPIIKWTAAQVFGLLAVNNLPVHPAYAASHGGLLDRRWLRVHPLRSKAPARSIVYGRDMDDWEDTYFPNLAPTRATPTKTTTR